MASFYGNIDLLKLNGSQIYTGIDQKNPSRAFICIPLDVNEIRVEKSKSSDAQLAKLRVNIWPLGESYKAKVRQSASERGDSNTPVPTHEIQLSFSSDYVKAVVKKFPKLVEQVKDANKERVPDICNQNPEDENSYLFKAIRNRMCKRIAMLYQPQPKTQTSPYSGTYAQVGTVSSYTASAENQSNEFGNSSFIDEDLPF